MANTTSNTASSYAKAPTASKSGLYGNFDGSMIQSTKQAQMHNEPIYAVGEDSLQGYLSFKEYDVISGAVITSGLSLSGTYELSIDGKRYSSGKTYVVQHATYAKV